VLTISVQNESGSNKIAAALVVATVANANAFYNQASIEFINAIAGKAAKSSPRIVP
jgi:hypothetical protein